MGNAVTVVCFATADWDAPLWTNKQHMMSHLAQAGVRVVYVDSPGHRRPAISSSDAKRVVRRLRAWRPRPRPVANNIWRDSPLLIPFHGLQFCRSMNRRILRKRLRRAEALLGGRPVLWTYTPVASDLFDRHRHGALLYHCVDDVGAFPGVDQKAFETAESQLISTADVVMASSRPLARRAAALGAKAVMYWPNVADVERIAAKCTPHPPTNRIGFLGAIQEDKIDIELLAETARLMPDKTFVLAGPVGLGLQSSTIDVDGFPANVEFVGTVTREDVASFLSTLDVGVIPYRTTSYTDGVFPMKVFEYLAAGLPVVSTSLPSLVGEVDHVQFADDPLTFVQQLRAVSLAEAEQAKRSTYAQSFSWESRAAEAVALLESFL